MCLREQPPTEGHSGDGPMAALVEQVEGLRKGNAGVQRERQAVVGCRVTSCGCERGWEGGLVCVTRARCPRTSLSSSSDRSRSIDPWLLRRSAVVGVELLKSGARASCEFMWIARGGAAGVGRVLRVGISRGCCHFHSPQEKQTIGGRKGCGARVRGWVFQPCLCVLRVQPNEGHQCRTTAAHFVWFNAQNTNRTA